MKNSSILILIAGIVGLMLVLCCACFFGLWMYVDSSVDDVSDEVDSLSLDDSSDSQTGDNEEIQACDDANSEYFSFHGVEEVIVSENPCEVIWLLAQEEDSYILYTSSGTPIHVVVWRDYVNNIQPGDTFTIRALDVIDDGISTERENAGISITRWVSSESELDQAKAEVKAVVEGLDY